MKFVCCLLVLTAFTAAAASAEKEEIESYLVAPYTQNKIVSVTMADGKTYGGRVISGDDDRIVIADTGGRRHELATNQISVVTLRRQGSSAKGEFFGSLIGGIGLGFAGAAIGKEIANGKNESGRAGPIIGGVAFGIAGSFLGKAIARGSATQEVQLTVTRGVEGQAPKVSSIRRLPRPIPAPRQMGSAALPAGDTPR